MFARLWWKDARQIWPIWVFLALAAALIQALLLYYAGHDARQGILGLSALTCASLYALAVGAAAFAGERETGTLGLLDIFAVDRRDVWTAKASFALVTTLALTVLLLAMAAMSTDRWNPQGLLQVWQALGFGLFVLVALAWGLFWSAILNNALTAAVVATCSAGLGLALMLATLDDALSGRDDRVVFSWLWQLLLISSTTIASALIFARGSRPRKVRFELRSPIVVTRTTTITPGPARLRLQSPVAMVLLAAPRPILEAPEAPLMGQSPRRSWVAEARKLAWQTVKEGRRSWCLLAVIGLVFPALVFRRWESRSELIWLIDIGVGLVAGANVFGLENRAQTYQFLNHHGVRPRLVWLVKLSVWSAGLAIVWGPPAVIVASAQPRLRGSIQDWRLFWLLTPLLFFAVAQLTGMVIRRGITAVVVALVIGVALAVPQFALIGEQMLPVEALLVVPAILLVVSWAWSGDWLFDRPAPGRWLRLGLLLISASILVAGWYASYRAWSIPDRGPIPQPAAWTEAAASPLPAAQNAAELYLEAGRRLVGPANSPESLNRNREVLALVHRAAARADCRFPRPQKPTLIDRPDLPPVVQLALLVSLDVKERQQHGDLAGAWYDIVVLFRMARHLSEPAGLARYVSLLSPERTGMGLAMEWALERGQTPERLLAALAAYRDLPKIPPAADAVRVGANLVENTLDLPASTFRDWLYAGRASAVLFDVATMPWERARARRVNRLLALAAIHDADREPWQRPRHADPEISRAERSTPLARTLRPDPGSNVVNNDRNEVGRRALVQVLALRAWQLRHRGQFPDHLDRLVPELLPSLPSDPYSGRPFGYVRASGQFVGPFSSALFAAPATVHAAAKGSWLLYSVGPDGQDDGGTAYKKVQRTLTTDIVFAIPPVEGDGGASNDKD